MKKYNKLVRDKIPDIIKESGKNLDIDLLDDDESKLEYLNRKLLEEVKEYLEDESLEELADIEEVILEILQVRKLNREDLEAIRLEKRNEKGGFEKGIVLREVTE